MVSSSGGVNLRIVGPPRRGGKATVTKTDVQLPSLTEEERQQAEEGGLGLIGPARRICLV